MFSDDNMSKNSRRGRKDRASTINQEIAVPDVSELKGISLAETRVFKNNFMKDQNYISPEHEEEFKRKI